MIQYEYLSGKKRDKIGLKQ